MCDMHLAVSSFREEESSSVTDHPADAPGCRRGGPAHGGPVGHERCCEHRERQRGPFSLVEPAVLAAVAKGEAHGYELKGAIEALTQGAVVVDPGGLYRVLRRLEDEGLVRSEWESGESGPQRRVYRLTEEGHSSLGQWAAHLNEKEASIRRVREAVEKSAAQGGEGL